MSDWKITNEQAGALRKFIYTRAAFPSAGHEERADDAAHELYKLMLAAPPVALAPSNAWAVSVDGVLDMRTVGPTRRSAIVNWLYVGALKFMSASMTDETIERMWEEHGPKRLAVVLPVHVNVFSQIAPTSMRIAITIAQYNERNRCANIADAEYTERARLAAYHQSQHQEESMDRCYSAARSAQNIASLIRNPLGRGHFSDKRIEEIRAGNPAMTPDERDWLLTNPQSFEACPHSFHDLAQMSDIGLPDTIYMTSPTMNLRWHCGVLEQMFIASTSETSWQAVPMTGG